MAQTTMNRRHWLQHAVAGAAALGTARRALAQADWPSQPLKFVVPFAAGGVTDVTMRMVGKHVQERLGQPMVFDNRPGAGGALGLAAVAKAAPNGYTIGATASASMIATPLLSAQLPFDPDADLAFVSLLATVPMVLTVPATTPVRNAAEFLQYVQANKGRLSYGSPAVGHYAHVAGMALSEAQQAGMVHSPYKGEAPALQDLLAGQLQFCFFSPPIAKSQMDGGRLRAIGVTGERRLKAMPDVPTLHEQGWAAPVFLMNPGWIGVIATARTPEPVLQRLSAEYMAAMRKPEVSDLIADQGMVPVGSSAEQFAATYRAERPVWKTLLAQAGLQIHGQ